MEQKNTCSKSIISEATHRRTWRGRASISSSTSNLTPPVKCSYKHKPPMEGLKVPADVIDNMLPVLKNAHQSEIRMGGGREDIQETCPKETSKGQWSTTKCISSICCIQQDVANASCSLPLRGEQEKGCTRGKIP